MKVNTTVNAFGYSQVARDKDSENPSYHQQHSQKREPQKDPQSEGESDPESEYKKVELAVEKFQSDAQAQASGLSVDVEGAGPGLKVVLKDHSGSVLRKLTGEEFLKLREATSKVGRSNGKILDQKL